MNNEQSIPGAIPPPKEEPPTTMPPVVVSPLHVGAAEGGGGQAFDVAFVALVVFRMVPVPRKPPTVIR